MWGWHECACLIVVLFFLSLLPKAGCYWGEEMGSEIVSSSFSRILWWLHREWEDKRAERKSKENMSGSDEGIQMCFPKWHFSVKLDLPKMSLSSRHSCGNLKRANISLVQPKGLEARGAPYLATNYTWSKKREEEEIKSKASLINFY